MVFSFSFEEVVNVVNTLIFVCYTNLVFLG